MCLSLWHELCGVSAVIRSRSGILPYRHIRFTYKSYGFNLSLMDTGYGLR